MPLPPSHVKKLNDHFGQYSIELRCKKCGHQRVVNPTSFARIFGWEAELAGIVKRLRCSKCDAKNVEASIGFERKPRRWESH